MHKFKCLRCGACCYPSDKEINKNKTRYIPIYLDELKSLLKISRDLNKNVNIKPDLVYKDKKKRLIIATYEMIIKEKCVFYDKGCIIYYNRPITCKSYPIMTWRHDGHRKILHVNQSCQFIYNNPELFNYSFSELVEFFPNEYKYAKELMMKGKEILHKILQLESDGIIDIGYLRNNRELFNLEVDFKDKKFEKWDIIELDDLEIDNL